MVFVVDEISLEENDVLQRANNNKIYKILLFNQTIDEAICTLYSETCHTILFNCLGLHVYMLKKSPIYRDRIICIYVPLQLGIRANLGLRNANLEFLVWQAN